MTVPAFLSMGLSEMILIAVVALLVFGGRLPEVMHTLGKTYAKLRRGMGDLSSPIRQEMRRLDEQARSPRPAAPTRANVPAAGEPPPYELPNEASSPATVETPNEPSDGPDVYRGPSRGAIDEPPPV